MSYTRVSTPPCKDCDMRHTGCHAKCEEYIEWSKKRQDEKEKAYKKYKDESMLDEYIYGGRAKACEKLRRQGCRKKR